MAALDFASMTKLEDLVLSKVLSLSTKSKSFWFFYLYASSDATIFQKQNKLIYNDFGPDKLRNM